MEKKDGFLSLIKGFIIGISSLIPGISPATILFSLNSYDDFINSFKNLKSNKKVLFLVGIPILIGIVLGIFSGVPLTKSIWSKYSFQSIMLYIGLIIVGLKVNFKYIKVNFKSLLIFLISIIMSLLLYLFLKIDQITVLSSGIKTIIISIASSLSFIIPSLSYFSLDLLKNINNIWLILLFIFIVLLILFSFSFVISKLLKRYRNYVYASLYGLLVSSLIIGVFQIDKVIVNFTHIFTSILAFMWGYVLAINIIKE